jgi:hypothetical protein
MAVLSPIDFSNKNDLKNIYQPGGIALGSEGERTTITLVRLFLDWEPRLTNR